jgi:hypothetical protein
MYFSNRPSIETRFREELFEKRVTTDLHVTVSHAQPLHARTDRNGSRIAVVQNPCDRGSASVCVGSTNAL